MKNLKKANQIQQAIDGLHATIDRIDEKHNIILISKSHMGHPITEADHPEFVADYKQLLEEHANKLKKELESL